ncbi:hypothetical protein CEXT_526961 [Caerostris extrusa]|uniref:Uncharacterized protein n=1 Tax=Caerostris extrusa TaxID=172846 RepID=A0AAV4VD20_CAEEX|nr:hypothetical protein CEXT_526961 [Caerostris extrusa]
MYAVVGIPAQIVAQRNMFLSSAFSLRSVSTVPETTRHMPEFAHNGIWKNKFKLLRPEKTSHILRRRKKCSPLQKSYASILISTVSQGTQTDKPSKKAVAPSH